MGIRKLKPVTPTQRFRTVADFAEITKSTPEKSARWREHFGCTVISERTPNTW